MTTTVITVDGSSLSCAEVAAVARQRAGVAVGEPAVTAARAAWRAAREVAARRPVYGRTTGVGANHVVPLSEGDRGWADMAMIQSRVAGIYDSPCSAL